MFTITNFWFEKARGSLASHVMMYVEEMQTYVHIWNIDEEGETPCVKESVLGTRRQKKVIGKKKITGLIAAAKKLM